MITYFVLINVEPLKEHGVYLWLDKSSDVAEVHPLFGEYDLLVRIDTETVEQAQNIVINKIRKIEGIISTKTLTGISG